MTEDEARKKICPMFNVNGPGFKHKCVASDCMAWREESFSDIRLQDHEVGYCGLAGKL